MRKPFWVRLSVLLLTGASVPFVAAHADDIALESSAGTIALISGKAWVRHGEITIPTPENETRVSPSVSFTDQVARELGPNDHIEPGDVVVTGDDSYLKIYYRDDSIMDVGPNATFKVSQFKLAPDSRQISFTLLKGKVRTLVTRALERTSFYRVVTPTSSMGVHGTEWVTHAYTDSGSYRTDVTVLEGKVVVDAPRPVFAGAKSTIEQIAVTPGKTFSGIGSGGSVSKFSVFKLSNEQIQNLIAMVPNIETERVGSIAAARLPGTGLAGPPPRGPTEEPGFGHHRPAAVVADIPRVNSAGEEPLANTIRSPKVPARPSVLASRVSVPPPVSSEEPGRAFTNDSTISAGGASSVAFTGNSSPARRFGGNVSAAAIAARANIGRVPSSIATRLIPRAPAPVPVAIRAPGAFSGVRVAPPAPHIGSAVSAASSAVRIAVKPPAARIPAAVTTTHQPPAVSAVTAAPAPASLKRK